MQNVGGGIRSHFLYLVTDRGFPYVQVGRIPRIRFGQTWIYVERLKKKIGSTREILTDLSPEETH